MMHWSDPHAWEMAKIFAVGAPFAVRPDGEPSKMDVQKIKEMFIRAVVTTVVAALVGWFLFVQDMMIEQKLLRQEIRNSNEANEIAHQSIIEGHAHEMNSIEESLREINHELRSMRRDFYIPRNGEIK